MQGKTVLITGATSGIGLEAAVQLAKLGARTVLVGRDPARTAAAVAEVKQRAGSGAVESLLCDFVSQEQVRKLAADYRTQHDRLDVLVNNAGTGFKERTLTADGIESTFAVNHLGAFLLTNLLLDLIVKSAPARIVNVSSRGHYRGTMDFDDLNFDKGYSITRGYGRAKLANVLFTRSLAKRLEGKGVAVNALHPGAVATKIWTVAPRWVQPILSIAKRWMLTPAQGASRVVFLAAGPEVEGQSGLYFDVNQVKQPSALALDEKLGERLWQESARLVRL